MENNISTVTMPLSDYENLIKERDLLRKQVEEKTIIKYTEPDHALKNVILVIICISLLFLTFIK